MVYHPLGPAVWPANKQVVTVRQQGGARLDSSVVFVSSETARQLGLRVGSIAVVSTSACHVPVVPAIDDSVPEREVVLNEVICSNLRVASGDDVALIHLDEPDTDCDLLEVLVAHPPQHAREPIFDEDEASVAAYFRDTSFRPVTVGMTFSVTSVVDRSRVLQCKVVGSRPHNMISVVTPETQVAVVASRKTTVTNSTGPHPLFQEPEPILKLTATWGVFWLYVAATALGWHFALWGSAKLQKVFGTYPLAPASVSDMMWECLAADLIATVVVFVASVATGNTSAYDIFWSVAPPVLAAAMAVSPVAKAQGLPLRRGVLLILVVFWGVRLTCNWWLSWHSLRYEDWRYIDIKRTVGGGALWGLTNFFGLHLYPTLQVFFTCAGIAAAMTGSLPLSITDCIAFGIIAFAIALQAVADQQMRDHRSSRNCMRPFTSGAWALCRHPNYLGEVLFWCGIALSGYAGNADFAVWQLALGPIALLGMFIGYSVPAMEDRQRKRREGYNAYCFDVPAALIPGAW